MGSCLAADMGCPNQIIIINERLYMRSSHKRRTQYNFEMKKNEVPNLTV